MIFGKSSKLAPNFIPYKQIKAGPHLIIQELAPSSNRSKLILILHLQTDALEFSQKIHRRPRRGVGYKSEWNASTAQLAYCSLSTRNFFPSDIENSIHIEQKAVNSAAIFHPLL